MRKICGLLLILTATVLASHAAGAQQPVRWEVSLDTAKRVASQSNRLVLAHFTAPWCGACRAMESEVFSQPSVAAAIEANYVPVKINVEYFPATARQYGITGLPTTVIIVPTRQGEALDSMRGQVKAEEYIARLNRVAQSRRGQQPVYAQIPAAPPAGAAPPANQPGGGTESPPSPNVPAPGAAPAGGAGPAPAVVPDQPIPVFSGQPNLAAGQGPAGPPNLPPAAPATVGPALPQPPVGLDGFCPVLLSERAVWTLGDRRWGARHRGRTYLFAGPDEQRRFLGDPDRYAPIHGGEDIVLAVEQGRSVPGARAHGATFGGRVYLFAEEGTLKKFSENPRFYAERAMQAMRGGMQTEQQMR
jgi:YHS domain-containing protein/thioredoxin-related protein